MFNSKKLAIACFALAILLVFVGCNNNKSAEVSSESGGTEIEDTSELVPQEFADNEMEKYYFDTIEFVEGEYVEDTEESVMTYHVTFSGKNYSYDGNVDLLCTSYSDDEDPEDRLWDYDLIYQNMFEWYVAGDWAEDESKPALSLHISNVDQENGTIDFSAAKYGSNPGSRSEKVDVTGDISCDTVFDFTGMGAVSAYRDIVGPGDETMKYQPPTLSFRYEFEDNVAVAFIIEADALRYDIEDHGERFRGVMEKDMTIESYENDYGYIEYVKKEK